jgi:ATP sulfurylase
LFEDLGEDIGIEPLFFDEIGYDPKTCSYKSVSESKSLKMISGTQARASLLKGHKLPSWFMREAVQESLCSEILQNRSILYE